jgi:preprotein translocase subunit SecF
MNKINLFQKRFLIYALLLHVGVGISFFIFNGESEENINEENKRIVEVNIAAPKPSETITAETFSEEDLAEEMANIASMQRNFSNNNKLNEANVKESKKELQALQNQSKKVKNQLIKDKKKLQKEKRKIEEDKRRAQKDKERLEKEKRDLEKELKKMKEEAKKKSS